MDHDVIVVVHKTHLLLDGMTTVVTDIGVDDALMVTLNEIIGNFVLIHLLHIKKNIYLL